MARSYPHPVLGNGDDVEGSGWQVSHVSTQRISGHWEMEYKSVLSNRTLLNMVAEKQCGLFMRVSCARTFFSEVFPGVNDVFSATIPASELNGQVDVEFFVCASELCDDYHIEGAHPDYAGHAFLLAPGDVLAVTDGSQFDATPDQEELRRIRSMISVRATEDPAQKHFTVNWEDQRIVVSLPIEDYRAYCGLEAWGAPGGRIMIASVVLPVLAEAVRQVNKEYDDDKRWMYLLKRRMDEVGESASEPLTVAQALLEGPVLGSLKALSTLAPELQQPMGG